MPGSINSASSPCTPSWKLPEATTSPQSPPLNRHTHSPPPPLPLLHPKISRRRSSHRIITMLRRCISELSSGRSVSKRNRHITAQVSSFLSSRNFSNASRPKSPQGSNTPDASQPNPSQGSNIPIASQPNPSQGSTFTKETSRSGNYGTKIFLGSIVVGAAAMAVYQTGYLDLNIKKEKSSANSPILDANKASGRFDHSADEVTSRGNEEQSNLQPDIETVANNGEPEKNEEPQGLKNLELNKEAAFEITPSEEEPIPVTVKESELSSFTQETRSSPSEQTVYSKSLSDDTSTMDDSISHTELHTEKNAVIETFVEPNVGTDLPTTVPEMEQNKSVETFVEQNDGIGLSTIVSEESGKIEATHSTSLEIPKESEDSEANTLKPLAQSYLLQVDEGISEVSGQVETADVTAKSLEDGKVSVVTSGSSRDIKESGNVKIVLDLIEAIDAAKRKQAESDAYAFAEERRILKEKYDKELKDARARELMYAEESAILDKELNKEKVKAAAALKMAQEIAAQNLRDELQRKEKEAAIQLSKAQELAKAELAAAIAIEKASQIEKLAEADVNISALCMAFFARSEEARHTHSVHKLALGTLALEDALSRGMPIRAVVDALHKSVEGIDRDSLLGLALSSLPEETLDNGTSTQMQLNQKFNSLKGSLRHFSIIPAGGGGILTHTLAHIASLIKVSGAQTGEGVESLISKVENLLLSGKIAEAADALEAGVRGSEAEELVAGWARQARNRAIVEQAHLLLQSYATSITFA